MVKYPSGIDSTTELPTIIDGISQVSGDFLNNLRDAIIAVETELGIKPSGIYTNVRSRLAALEFTVSNIGSVGFIASGDLSGTLTSQTVIAINGAPVPIAGSLTTGHVLQVTGPSSLTYNYIVNANIDSAAAIVYSKLALSNGIIDADINSSANIAGTKISPDFGSQNIVTTGNLAVAGASNYGSGLGVISIANATANPATNPPAGVVAYVDASDGYLKYRRTNGTVISLDGAGGGGGSPTGSAGGDLGGSYPNPTVVSITGGSGVVNIGSAGNIITWNTATTAPGIKQADKTTNSGTGAALTIQAQNETGTTSTGGALNLTSGTGTSAAGAVVIKTGGTTRLTANASGVVTVANLSTGVVHADSSGNLTSSTIVNADVSGSAAIAVSKLASGTSAQVLLNNATPTPTWTTLSSDVTISATGVTTVNSISGSSPIAITPNILQWIISATPTFKQIDQTAGSTSGATLTIQAQNATGATSTGGILSLTSGTGTTAAGTVVIKTGGTTRLTANATGVITIANLGTGVVHADSSGNLTSSTIVNADVNASAAIAGTKISPDFGSQNIATTGNLAVAGAPSYGSGVGVISISNATTNPSTNPSGGIVAYVDVSDGYLKYRKADGTVIFLDGGSGGGGSFTAGGDLTGTSSSQQVVSLTGSGGFVNIATTGATLNWATGTSTPTLKQANNTTNSATAQDLTVQAQNATGTTSVGGNLVLQSGTGTSRDGYVNFNVGSSNVGSFNTKKFTTTIGRRVKTTTTTTNLTVTDSDEVIMIGTLSGIVTITLPASPTDGDLYVVKDRDGSAAVYNITVSGNGNNIDGLSTYLINTNYQSISLIFSNGKWSVI